MYPISDLTAFCRRTTGDVPPKLVGASTTVVGSKMYLYGGRLVQERRMVSDIYMFDLESFNWERLVQDPEDDIPQARYFHSADTWNNHLIIFGGMAIKPQSDNPEDLCVLNDVRLFDLSSGHWLPSPSTVGDPTFVPNARYAHLSSVTGDRLFIIGGQDLANVWLDDVYIYDLVAKSWVQRRDYSRHCGTYRSVAVTADMRVRLPQEEMQAGESLSSKLGPPGARFKTNKTPSSTAPITQPDSLIHLPYSASPTDDYPCDIFLFSNYNFTDVQRELEVFTPLPDYDFAVSDRSAAMSGTYFPPGLRFPTGAILGTFFIVAGTYLSQQYQSFSIWALDLINMNWSRIDPGSALASGSWFRGCLWPAMNKFMVFGNRHGSIVEDYNRRLLSWDHVTCIDLEAFGIYQPPALRLEIPMQELGLAALEEGVLTDFEIVCDDDRRIACSRKMLEDRWPWFKEQRKLFAIAATQTTEMMPSIAQHVPVPDLRGISDKEELRPDPRLTPRAFHLSEPYPVTLALVQYFYTTALITPVQHAPAVLSQLLLLSSTYQLPHLQDLVKHAMHRALSYATSVGIYGVSTLCNCRSLQIRALRVVMAYSQKRPTGGRSRSDREGGSGDRHHDSNNGGDRHGPKGGGPPENSAARPRGLSDASYLRGPSDGRGGNSGQGYMNGFKTQKLPAKASDPVPLITGRPRAMSEVVAPRSCRSRSWGPSRPGHSTDTSLSDTSTVYPGQGVGSPSSAEASTSRGEKTSYSSRPFSMISLSTDEELRAVAEIMSPVIAPSDLVTGAQDVDSRSVASSSMASDARSNKRSSYRTSSDSLSLSTSSCTPSTSYVCSPTDAESDGHYSGFGDSALLSPTLGTHIAFHLPRTPRRMSQRDSDTPSLSSSVSFSSLSTPSLSRTSSFHRSPPISPTSSMSPLFVPPTAPARPSHLDAIQENRVPEDEGVPPDSDDPFVRTGIVSSPMVSQDELGHEIVATDSDGLSWNHNEDSISEYPNLPPTACVSETSLESHPTMHQSSLVHGAGALTRLFSRSDKDAKNKAKGKHSLYQEFSASALSLSLAKAEEKRTKKEAVRRRAETLALERYREKHSSKQPTVEDVLIMNSGMFGGGFAMRG